MPTQTVHALELATSKPGPKFGSLAEQIASLHACLSDQLPSVQRIAAALYDAKTDKLKTFVHSTEGALALVRYEARLAEVPSLLDLARSGKDRIIDDVSVFKPSPHEHSRWLLGQGFQSSYTTPFYDGGNLAGFLFFDSKERGAFTPAVVEKLSIFGHLVALLLVHSLTPVRMLRSALHVASKLSHFRDPETGAHLDRMCRYARLMAQELAPTEGLSDEFVEFLFLFAPLHDIGKVAIPDRILLKPGRLTDDEFEVMKSHVTKGREIVDDVIGTLGLQSFPHIERLRNVVLYHHESIDGSGYPDGLSGERIPVEARIVAVADVFDALTSARPYKAPWSLPDAFSYLGARAGTKFDASCVAALTESVEELNRIRQQFPDEESSPSLQSREGYTDEL